MEDQDKEMYDKMVQLASAITGMKVWWSLVDVDHAKETISQLRNQASRQDSLAALSARYNPAKSDQLRLQAKMLQAIVDTIEIGKEITELGAKIQRTEEHYSEIDKLFL